MHYCDDSYVTCYKHHKATGLEIGNDYKWILVKGKRYADELEIFIPAKFNSHLGINIGD